MSGTKIQCIFVAIGLSSTTRAATTNTFLYFFTGNYTNSKSDTLNEIPKNILIGGKIQNVFFISTDSLGSPVTRMFTNSPVDLTNTNSSDVGIITPSTNTPTTTVSTTTTTTSKPATTAGSNALHHAASQGKNSIQPHQANVL